jgi:hypothetical protein
VVLHRVEKIVPLKMHGTGVNSMRVARQTKGKEGGKKERGGGQESQRERRGTYSLLQIADQNQPVQHDSCIVVSLPFEDLSRPGNEKLVLDLLLQTERVGELFGSGSDAGVGVGVYAGESVSATVARISVHLMVSEGKEEKMDVGRSGRKRGERRILLDVISL